MKKLTLFLIACVFMAGCSITDSQLKTVQPSNNKMWKPDQQLFEIKASKILFESPVETITKDGVTTTRPVMITTRVTDTKGNVTETTEPVLAEFHAKDTSAKPPKTAWDIVDKGLGLGVTYMLGYKALSVIGLMSSDIAKDPLVVTTPAPKTDFVSTDPAITIDRG